MEYTQEKEIVVETNRRLVIRRYRNEAESWCTVCVQLVRWLTPEELALVVGGSSRAIYRQAENGQAHFFETADGLLLICLNSILANSASSLLNCGYSDSVSTDKRLPANQDRIRQTLALQPQMQSNTRPGTDRLNELAGYTYKAQQTEQEGSQDDHFFELLACLDSDPEVAGEKYNNLHQKLCKLFECNGCKTATEMADVVLDRVARKISSGADIPPNKLASYCHGVARNLMHEYFRAPERRVTSLSDLDQINHPVYDPKESEWLKNARLDLEYRLGCLGRLLADLPDESRNLLTEYYQGEKRFKIERRKELAEKLGITTNALKIRMYRLRLALEQRFNECVTQPFLD